MKRMETNYKIKSGIKEIVKQASELTDKDIIWYPLYSNNLVSNKQCGIYTYIYHEDEGGKLVGRKYTIRYQLEDSLYILFEQTSDALFSFPRVCKPKDNSDDLNDDDYEVNDYGDFVYAFMDLEKAKARALENYKMVFEYALSYLIEEEEKDNE